jgi:glycosyltransferase involved in cell wall biosynthesis
MNLNVVCAVLFSPRGGSAHVVRALVRGLRAQGASVTLLAGSRDDLGPHGNANVFYGDVHAVDFAPALASGAPLRFDGPPGTAPMHPSFEDRPDALDVVFARLDDLDYERQVRAWARELDRAGAADADVLYLHHLTPLNEAAARVASRVPVVGHLHGTELLMLEQIAAGPPEGWRYGDRWAERMRGWARRCSALIVAPAGVERALDVLDVPRERIVSLPGGVDTDAFAPRPIDRESFWRHVLVEDPQGWLPGRAPGSVGYDGIDVERLARGVVLLYVGRFTAVKRLDRLIAAFARVQPTLKLPAGLVLVGGHPGEWEGEHPAQIADRLGARSVFLAGWRDHDELPSFFAAADAVVLTSEREQFGQVLVEAMASELPVVATRTLGPESIVDDGRTGWLTPPGDEEALTRALIEVVGDPGERARRGRHARQAVCERFTWSSASARLARVFEDVSGTAPHAPAVEA